MKKTILGLCALFITTVLFAAPRTAEQAAVIAADFTNAQPQLRKMHKSPRTASTMRLAHTATKPNSTEAAYYVFNQENNSGAIFISADDRTMDVLGYTESGQFDPENVNPNLAFWLNRYAEEIAGVNEQNAYHGANIRKAVQKTAIAPLLKNNNGVEITWYQEEPYYNLCPEDQRDHTTSLTGCVATAASQIMYKWRYPEKGTGSHKYTWYDCKNNKCTSYWTTTIEEDFSKVTFDWANMLPAYKGISYTTTQATAVATLMYNVGVACNMQYGGDANEGSGAWTDDMGYGLVTYFGYKLTKFITTYASKSDYEYAKGDNLANIPAEFNLTASQIGAYFDTELEAGRPILMGGESTKSGGHEFVCNGRNSEGKFYINWGWEGEDNGYFSLTSLDPYTYNFSSEIDAIIGLEPDVPLDPVAVTGVSLAPKSKTIDQKEKLQLTATIAPSNATDKKLTWSSDKTSVATVDANGLVVGVAQGTATITVKTHDGNFQDQAVITVTDNEAAYSDCTPYSYTFTKGEGESTNLGSYYWTINMTGSNATNFDSQYHRGAQFGTSKKPATKVSLVSANVKDCELTDVVINACVAASGNANLTVSIGGEKLDTKTLSQTATDYTFKNTNRAQGNLEIVLDNKASKAMYIKYIKTNTNVPSDIEIVPTNNTNSIKRIENGQLVIIVDGIKYNALGQTIE